MVDTAVSIARNGWRDALNSVVTAPKSSISLTSYEKGQLLALIGVQKVYSEADVNACVEGLDGEALCGFFKTLLPVSSTPAPTSHLPPEPPSPVSSATVTSSQNKGDNAQPLQDFDEWVKSHPCKKFTNVEDLQIFLQRAPIPSQVYEFIRSHLHCVPKGGGHLHTVESVGGTCFSRDDYFVRLVNLGNKGTKVVMFSGRKGFGKSVALPHELVRARNVLLGVRDQVVFFYPGYGHIPESCFPTVIRLLAHMRIPALFDEFIEVFSVDIGKAYNILLDTKQEVEPLSAVLFGSDEVSIWNKGFWFERESGVAVCERLPVPPLSVMYQMLRFKESDLQGCPLGLRFLRKMALYGYDLSGHMDAQPSDSLKTLKKTGVQAFGSFYGGYLTALELLIKNSNCSAGVDSYKLSYLEKSEYVIRSRNNPLVFDFLNPQTVAYQAALMDLSEEDVEERVLQQLLRQRKHLLDELLDKLGIPISGEEVFNHMWCGPLSKDIRADMLFFHGDEAFLVSAKRAQGAQDWQSCFVRVLDLICKEWKHLDKELCRLLVAATKLRFVAVSASDEGYIGGTQPFSYSTSIVTDSKLKRVTCERVFLHELLERLVPVGCLQH